MIVWNNNIIINHFNTVILSDVPEFYLNKLIECVSVKVMESVMQTHFIGFAVTLLILLRLSMKNWYP